MFRPKQTRDNPKRPSAELTLVEKQLRELDLSPVTSRDPSTPLHYRYVETAFLKYVCVKVPHAPSEHTLKRVVFSPVESITLFDHELMPTYYEFIDMSFASCSKNGVCVVLTYFGKGRGAFADVEKLVTELKAKKRIGNELFSLTNCQMIDTISVKRSGDHRKYAVYCGNF
jgi:hypothetical protein